ENTSVMQKYLLRWRQAGPPLIQILPLPPFLDNSALLRCQTAGTPVPFFYCLVELLFPHRQNSALYYLFHLHEAVDADMFLCRVRVILDHQEDPRRIVTTDAAFLTIFFHTKHFHSINLAHFMGVSSNEFHLTHVIHRHSHT